METVTLHQAAKLLNVKYRTLRHWVQTGIIRTVGGAFGNFERVRLDPVDLLAACIGRSMRSVGLSLAACGDAVEILRGLGLATLQEELNSDNTHLIVVGKFVLPKLVPVGFIASSTLRQTLKAKKLLDTPPAAVDVGRAFRFMNAAIVQLEREDAQRPAAVGK